jgi:REP element-mobilizing transposase RayT
LLLPDYMHCIWARKEKNSDFSKRRGLITAKFSK